MALTEYDVVVLTAVKWRVKVYKINAFICDTVFKNRQIIAAI
jgi:hypothetical protein